MSTETVKRTEFAVARGNEVITEWMEEAHQAFSRLAQIESAMVVASLEPDVHVVQAEVEYITKRSRAKAYEEPAEPAPKQEVIHGDVVLPPNGVWGDTKGEVSVQDIVASQRTVESPAPAVPMVVVDDTTDTPRTAPEPGFVPDDDGPSVDPEAKAARKAARSKGTSDG